MKKIDLDRWKRKIPYENFIGYTNPIFSLCTRLDVTNLYNASKARKTSFFTDFLYVVMKSLNSLEEFRLRILKGEVVLYDVINPSYIVMSDSGVILTCRSEMRDNYAEFYANVRNDIENTKKSGNSANAFNVTRDNNYFFISCMPWTDLMSVNNPYDLKDAENSCIPRLTWGKAVNENGRMKMMMDISAHHALIDGEPVCRAFNIIQNSLNDIEKVLK